MRRRPFLAVLVLVTAVSACQTGKRPSFVEDPFPKGATTGDAAIDGVLSKLDSVADQPFTATYEITTKFGNVTRTASVSVTTGRRSVTFGSVRYLTSVNSTSTCVFDGAPTCSAGLDLARISDTLLTPDFYAADAAKRLRRDAQSTVVPTSTRPDTVGNQPVTCVDLSVTGGIVVYCVLDSGVLAKIDDADVAVTLTSWVPTATEALFATNAL
jgi:hypothetical protein